ncbi:hypothetical protein GCM10010269_81840 [Streptomyces humidus]|uniref:Zinc-binding dehydrogenase n=1 Tax=Streptomyces humidus TaxID=52259 RepID=A0A918GEC7_9ACTN|nr:hypothetical protein [Streptomyces humidus]GGS30879.1 hypothetical protein GCM10010269_81840 [Streptomyces humidus]
MTVWSAASCRHIGCVCGKPWSSTTGLPEPPTAAFSLRRRAPTHFAGVPAARAQAAAALGAGAILVLAGLTPESIVVHDSTGSGFRGNQIRGHYGSGFEHVEQLIGLASAGRIDLAPSVAAHIPLAEAADAVTRLGKKIGGPIRFVLTP